MNIEIIRNTLYKAYLEASYQFWKDIGGTTADCMCEISAIFVLSSLQSIPFELNSAKMIDAKLYSRCGKLNPDGLAALARAEDYDQVKAVVEYYAEFSKLFEDSGNNQGDKTMEDTFFEHQMNNKLS
ncbi:hypothetical protein HHI36_005472 [Cryptolaemus montrouzieri]|uniref:Uncharacterized protein n=1 Tax=Cryptolaemus montrouzieri TaxID=559131 RepID=A0ABD2NUJ1_9CUCU